MRLAKWIPCWFPPTGRQLLTIRIQETTGQTRIVSRDQLPIVVGRSESADIRLSDRWVSQVHCSLRVVDNCLRIQDLESRNGTVVNGETVSELEIKVGDVISLGATRIEVLYVALNNSSKSTSVAVSP